MTDANPEEPLQAPPAEAPVFDDACDPDTEITCVTDDGESLTTEYKYVKKSVTIHKLVEDQNGGDDPIPLTGIPTKLRLERCLTYFKYLVQLDVDGKQPPKINKPLSSIVMSEIADEECAAMVDPLTQDELFAYVMDMNYLDCKTGLEMSCAKVTSNIKNKDVKEIRQYFKIENDFTPEEEAQAHAEAEWVEKNM